MISIQNMCYKVLYSVLEKGPKYGSVLLSKLQRKTTLVTTLKIYKAFPQYSWYYLGKFLPLNITKRSLQLKEKFFSCFLKTCFHTVRCQSSVEYYQFFKRTKPCCEPTALCLDQGMLFKDSAEAGNWQAAVLTDPHSSLNFLSYNSQTINGTKLKCTA